MSYIIELRGERGTWVKTVAFCNVGASHAGGWCCAVADLDNADSRRVLFDWADILYYNAAGLKAVTAESYTYEHPDWSVNDGCGHINTAARIRIAKALVWMCAKMLGWEQCATEALYALKMAPAASGARTRARLFFPFPADYEHGMLFDCGGRVPGADRKVNTRKHDRREMVKCGTFFRKQFRDSD